MCQSRMARVYKETKLGRQSMEDLNSDDPLEIDARRDEEKDFKAMKEDDEKRIYDKVYSYLIASRYPEDASKVDKATIRKRSKKFEVVDGVLHYKESKGNSVNLRQVSCMNSSIMFLLYLL